MIMAPLVTIVTVVYNAVETLEETILSVLNQSYDQFEYLILDGGSTDGTVDIIKKYADRLSYWCSEHDNGIYDAMNKAISHGSGKWINFMNAGDVFFHRQTLEAIFQDREYADDVLYGDMISRYPNDTFIYNKAQSVEALAYRMPFCHQSAFVRMDLMKMFPFDTKFRLAADYDFFYRLYFERKGKFLYLPYCIAIYSMDGVSSTNSLTGDYKIINGRNTAWRAQISSKIERMLPTAISSRIRRFTRRRDIVDIDEARNLFARQIAGSLQEK